MLYYYTFHSVLFFIALFKNILTYTNVPKSGFLNMLLAFWAEKFFVVDEAVLCFAASLGASLASLHTRCQ